MLRLTSVLLSLGALGLAGCVLAPKGLDEERDALAHEDREWSKPVEQRALPELSPEPSIEELLRRAESANPELERAWQDWRGSLAHVVSEASYPDSSLNLSLEQMFPGGLAFDRTRIGIGFDPMLMLPAKVAARGKVAFEASRVQGERFRALRVDLRLRVRVAWEELWLAQQQARSAEELASLLVLRKSVAEKSVAAGDSPRALLRLEFEVRLNDDEMYRRRVEVGARKARLNALLARASDAPLEVPFEALPTRDLPADDAQLFAFASHADPALAVLAAELAGREDALELARRRFLPDFSPMASITGDSTQSLGLGIGLPIALPGLRAGLEEARASIAAIMAQQRGRKLDTAAELTAELLGFREAERTLDCCENLIEPLAQRLAASAESSYAAGSLPQRDWLESLAMVSRARIAVAEARAVREIALARIEALLGGDLAAVNEQESPHE
ncbi:MAG: TolC family protein [Planctomycetes bacterium]|nr:TolC family protein [Planctomycetota bacterium]